MRKPLKILTVALCMATASMAVSPRAQALVSAFDAINFKPAISNKTDYFGIYSSQTVAKHGWNAGFYIDYARHPLEIGQPLGTRVSPVIDDTIVGNFYATYGILDVFSVGLNIPVAFWNNYFNNTVAQFPELFPIFSNGTGNFDGQTNLGDIRLEFKVRILNNEDKLIGLALVPFMSIPSGASYVFMGNGTVTGGVKVVLDFNIHERVKLALNVGYLARDDFGLTGAAGTTRIMDDQILLGLGLSVKIIDRLMFIAEAETDPLARDPFANEAQTPTEVRGGFRVKATDNISINVGGGAGLTLGVGTPDFRAFLGLNYNWAPPECPACEAAPVVEARKIVISQVIHFAFDKAVIRPQSYAILDDVAAIIKANPSIRGVSIEGNTDSIGSDAYNQRLSERRAASVKEYLVRNGIPGSMLQTVGYGESRPVATNATAEGRAQNRRVEFKVLD